MPNIDNLTKWFLDRRGQLTYSMYGSRNGTDGTADCSGSISTALKSCGFNINGLPSTVTLGTELAKNGFYKIAVNQDWNAQKNDIILMSWGNDMSSSGGEGGHVGVMLDSDNFISVDYTTGGQQGTAVHTENWNNYYFRNKPQYIEVWRYNSKSMPKQVAKPQEKAYYIADEVRFVNGIWQIRCNYLAPVGFDWTDNGIPVSMVNWVDAKTGKNIPDGADKDFKKGMGFSFEGDEAHIFDLGIGGYYGGYYWRKYNFGQFGTVWLSTWNKDDLVNYYS